MKTKNYPWKYLLCFWLLVGPSSMAQDYEIDLAPRGKSKFFFRAAYQIGTVLPTNVFVRGENVKGEPYNTYRGFNIEFGKQTYGSRFWEQLYRLPTFGLGFSMLDPTKGRSEIGSPLSLYGFLRGPIIRGNRLTFNYDFGLGLSWNWNPYDLDVNAFQIAISTQQNAYIHAGINLVYSVSKRFELEVGGKFNHYSNGAINIPNKGMNFFGPEIGIKYKLYTARLEYQKKEIPKLKRKSEVQTSISFGIKNVQFDTTDRQQIDLYGDVVHFMFNANAIYVRHMNHGWKTGAGIDISYDGALESQSAVELHDPDYTIENTKDKLALGLLWYLEWVIGDLSVQGSIGYEILRNSDHSARANPFFQRIGVKYHLGKQKKTFCGFLIRATHASDARYFEWQIGRRISW